MTTSFGFHGGDLMEFRCPKCKLYCFVNTRAFERSLVCKHFGWDNFIEAVWQVEVDNEDEGS